MFGIQNNCDGLTMYTCGAGHDDGRADDAKDDVAIEGVQESSRSHIHTKRAHRLGQVEKAEEKQL